MEIGNFGVRELSLAEARNVNGGSLIALGIAAIIILTCLKGDTSKKTE